jgi:hypothetical protein
MARFGLKREARALPNAHVGLLVVSIHAGDTGAIVNLRWLNLVSGAGGRLNVE